MPDAIHHTLTLAPGPGNARNSEGSFIALRDGRIRFVYTRFTGTSHDDGEASLVARTSHDGGLSWSAEDEPVTAVPGMNVMSVSLLRLADGRIGLWYLLKESRSQWTVLMRTSDDETATWSEPLVCSPAPGLYVLNNDRAVQLAGGRLVLPVAWREPSAGRGADEAWITCLLSDDGGASWRFSRDRRRVPGVWTQEPGVIERCNGSLLLWCRTQAGSQYVSESPDGGESWAELRPSGLVSTLSPACIKRLPGTGELLLVWNHVDQPWQSWEVLARSPLHVALSRDDGATWEGIRPIEDAPERWFCYTAIAFHGNRVLLGYTAGEGRTHQRMATLRLAWLPLDWLRAAGPGEAIGLDRPY